ncbi:PP2C family serine/threonine-protein phosphatase [Bordetella genomosp. 9]|uniref:PPM-type phosphatase domain-containing protein n=1 Tax=Bordetella genomosp. 9 TaxID=1416803 RepID=A0A1W6YXL0_9BORD|nr:PP2C family serine/threonine-protein phosphatase [Bordetella genomosp. 9]ARP85817.1 hypothetical protein CAL13_06050 [Bordetella genomosp. 9]
MDAGEWRGIAASVIGSSHIKTETPCQDSHAFCLIEAAEPILVLVASDGAGSASRSDAGSSLACRSLVACIQNYLHQGGSVENMTRDLACEWLDATVQSMQDLADSENLPLREFACTLLAAVVGPHAAAYLQIGDGAMVVLSDPEEWSYIFWPDHGEYINTTAFLTDASSRESFKFEAAKSTITDVAVFTDGIEPLVLRYATREVHSQFFNGIFKPVRSLSRPGLDPSLSGQLAAYLASAAICDRTDDDKTLLLASRGRPYLGNTAAVPEGE